MKLERTDGELRSFAERLFQLLRELTGNDPTESGGYYRVGIPNRSAIYLQLVERGGTKNHPNSIQLSTEWRDELAGEGVTEGNNFHGSGSSAELNARANNPEEVARAEGFIRRAVQ